MHILGVDLLYLCLFVVWAREENRILETKGTLLGNEALEGIISEVALLTFVFLEFLDARLRYVSLGTATLWCLLLLR